MKKKPFDKYYYYLNSVQSPEEDVVFFQKTYQSFYKKRAHTFREDFCGSFAIGLAWVKAHSSNKAIVVDRSEEPLRYGKKHHLSQLKPKDQKRIKILKKSVLSPQIDSADIISVSNFSYFIFKDEKDILKYFKNVRKQINKKGLFILDTFGGSQCYSPNEESIEHEGFTYYWDQDSFDPVTNYAKFYIHFKRKNEKKREKVFTYDWRVWSIPEIQSLLKKAGFSETHVYWEGSDSKGNGSGVFKKATKGEACESWIAYLVSKP